jgi:hypothetical protein
MSDKSSIENSSQTTTQTDPDPLTGVVDTDGDASVTDVEATAEVVAEDPEQVVPQGVQDNLVQAIWQVARKEIAEYQGSLQQAELQRIRELAPKSEFEIQYFEPTGKTFTNPFGEKEEETNVITKTIQRRKISQSQFKKISDWRFRFRTTPQKQRKEGDIWNLYEYMAYCYFKMTPEEFKHTDWEEMRPILDACEERTARGLPFTPNNSAGPSTLQESQGIT